MITQGATKLEAIAHVREAIALMLEVLREQGKPVPGDALEAFDCCVA